MTDRTLPESPVARALSIEGAGYRFSPGAALDVCVGRQGVYRNVRDAGAGVSPFGDGPPALVAESRGDFIAGLVQAWAHQVPVLLVPSTTLLHRLHFRPRLVEFEPEEAEPAEKPAVLFDPGAPLCRLATSGSTKSPQIFEKCARQLFSEAHLLAQILSLSQSSTVLSTTAPHHVYGLLFSLLAPWASGARVVVDPDNEPGAFHPESLARLCSEWAVTHLVTVPAHLVALLEAPFSLPTLRTVTCSAAVLDPDVAKRFESRFGVEVLDILGSTETGGIATRRPACAREYRPLPPVKVHTDEDGRLFVRSPFLPHPESPFESGDRAEIRADGTFLHLGRVDGVLKVAGKRMSSQEIEHLVRAISGVTDAVCFGRSVEGMRGQEILLAVEGRALDKSAIKAALRQRMDSVFLPRKIRILERFPRTDRGKVEREAILQLFAKAGDDLVHRSSATSRGAHDRATPPVAAAPTGEAVFVLDANSVRFSGHFADDPLLPALAQLTDLVLPVVRRHFGGLALSELTRVKWTQPLRPGARVRTVVAQGSSGVRFEIYSGPPEDENLACTGSLKLEPETGPPSHRGTEES